MKTLLFLLLSVVAVTLVHSSPVPEESDEVRGVKRELNGLFSLLFFNDNNFFYSDLHLRICLKRLFAKVIEKLKSN